MESRDGLFRHLDGVGCTVCGKPIDGGRIRLLAQREEHARSEEHTSELQSHSDLVCRLLLEHLATTALYTLSLHDALPISQTATSFGQAIHTPRLGESLD